MGVNHYQFSHLCRFRPDSHADILQMMMVLAKIVYLVASGLHISLEPGGQCRQVVCAEALWR